MKNNMNREFAENKIIVNKHLKIHYQRYSNKTKYIIFTVILKNIFLGNIQVGKGMML